MVNIFPKGVQLRCFTDKHIVWITFNKITKQEHVFNQTINFVFSFFSININSMTSQGFYQWLPKLLTNSWFYRPSSETWEGTPPPPPMLRPAYTAFCFKFFFRSGSEGYYPQLVESAEKKLKEIHPKRFGSCSCISRGGG